MKVDHAGSLFFGCKKFIGLLVAALFLALSLAPFALAHSQPQSDYLCKALDKSDVAADRPVVGLRLASVDDAFGRFDGVFDSVLFAIAATLTPVDGWLQSHAASPSVQASVFFDPTEIDAETIMREVVTNVSGRDGFSVGEWERFIENVESRVHETGSALHDDSGLMVEISFIQDEGDSLTLLAEVIEQSFPGGRMDRSLEELLYRVEIPLVAVDPEMFLPVLSDQGLEAEGNLYDLVIEEATRTKLSSPVP